MHMRSPLQHPQKPQEDKQSPGNCNRTLIPLSISSLLQSILLLRITLQIRAICEILVLLTERIGR